MLSAITKQLIKMPWLTMLLLGAIFAVLGTYAIDLQIEPSFDTLISSTGEYNTQQRKLEAAFPQNTALFIIFSLEENSLLQDRPTDLRETTLEEDIPGLIALINQSQFVTGTTPLEFSPDGKQARMVVGAQEPNTPDGLVLVRDEVSYLVDHARLPVGVTATVTGLPVLLDRVSTLLIRDNLSTILITAALVFGVLFWYFKSVKVALISVASPVLSLLTLAALMEMLNIGITLTLAAVGVIVIGIGADYSIHLITTYMRHLQSGQKPREAINESLDELEVPLVAAFLTTAAGFVALILGVSPSSQAQGIVLTLAITIIFVATFLLLPVLLVAFVKKASKQEGSRMSAVDGAFDKLAHYQTRHPWQIILIVLVLTVVMIGGASQVSFSTSNSNWIPDDDPVASSFRELTYAFGDTESLILVLESTDDDLRGLQTVRDVQELKQRLEGIGGLEVITPYDGVELDQTAIYEHVEQSRIRSQFNADYTLTTITIQSEGFQVNEAGESLILPEVQDTLDRNPIHKTDVGLFGDLVRFDELGRSLQQDTGVTTGIGLILVFVVSSILYSSLAIGVVALIPIIIAVIWAVGLMGFFNVPFTSLSTGIISLVLGIGVDFSLHMVSSINFHKKKGKPTQEAIESALKTTGGAIMLSSITTFFGFLALTFAVLLGTQRLGYSLAFSIASVFIVTIMFVPAVLSVRERLGKRLNKQRSSSKK